MRFGSIRSALLFLLFVNMVSADPYKISLLGTGKFSDGCNCDWECNEYYGFNDEGQIFYIDRKDTTNNLYVCNQERPVFVADFPYYNWEPENVILNNAGLLIYHIKNRAFIWSETFKEVKLDVFGNGYVRVSDINDLGQMVGKTKEADGEDQVARPFFWDNGTAVDMGPGSPFAQQFVEMGFHPLQISLESINNQGEILGFFSYGKYHKIKDRIVAVGIKYFLWDGTLHIVPLPEKAEQSLHGIFSEDDGCYIWDEYGLYCKSIVNNNGVVAIRCPVGADPDFESEICNITYLWSVGRGLQEIINFAATDLNDSGVVFGIQCDECDDEVGIPAIWFNGSFTTVSELLGGKELSNLAPPYSDLYDVEQLGGIKGINNKGQIFGMGRVWNEWHPCVIEPSDEQE